ncbi:MAG: hypothetical protein ACLTDX_21455, partial [[Clostridium] innocuum]
EFGYSQRLYYRRTQDAERNTLGATRTLPQLLRFVAPSIVMMLAMGIYTITDTPVCLASLVNYRCTFRNQYRLRPMINPDHWFILDAGKREALLCCAAIWGRSFGKGSAKCRSALCLYDWNRLCPCSCSFAVP